PRPYPPGVLLLVAPVALAYHHTALSFSAANRLLLFLLLGAAHLAIYLFVLQALEWGPAPVERWLTLAAASVWILRWTANGFYDAAAIVPLAACARLRADRRPLGALLA